MSTEPGMTLSIFVWPSLHPKKIEPDDVGLNALCHPAWHCFLNSAAQLPIRKHLPFVKGSRSARIVPISVYSERNGFLLTGSALLQSRLGSGV